MHQPPKVLITSRNVSTRETASTMLLRDGCAVDQASDLASTIDAIEHHHHHPPMVLLVDATAPNEELRTLLDNLEHGSLRVVMLAASRTPSSLRCHPAVTTVIDDGSNLIGALMSLGDWIHRFEQQSA